MSGGRQICYLGFFFFCFAVSWACDPGEKRNEGLRPYLRVFVCVGICLGDEARHCVAAIFPLVSHLKLTLMKGEERK